MKTGFGEPDEKKVFEDKSEIWTYYNREDGRTFRFIFSARGAVERVQISPPEDNERDQQLERNIEIAH